MMISDGQARLALDRLQAPHPTRRHAQRMEESEISPEFMAVVMNRIAELPDTRQDRVWAAGKAMEEGISSSEVADEMVRRLISDQLR